MGKKARKTRWRALTINDNEYSDSEESNTTTTQGLPKGYQPRSYYNKFSYSSQSTPRRRYQHDSTKSTRSSSTASENKITFNEDEYTKITTPRQDVLFKKGYLNKPKNYQTQTSTGTSTTSTGNSTGNGTPDHQSTDLEYESQFVFPNGFVDQNGIYYVNSYETYPLMLYNPPTYYPEFSNFKSKRYSTGSLTESTSPNNEEATSQDLSGGEASNNVSDYSGHHQVYNMVYPGYYVNGVCPPHDAVDGQNQTDQTRRIKKRRRRKTSKSQTAQDSSEYTEDENDSCNEENCSNIPVTQASCDSDETSKQSEAKPVENAPEPIEETNVTETKDAQENSDAKDEKQVEVESNTEESVVKSEDLDKKDDADDEVLKEKPSCVSESAPEAQETKELSVGEGSSTEIHQEPSETKEDSTADHPENPPVNSQKSELKPDAEEFIPRAYRTNEIPINPNLQFIKVPPSFIPIPIVPLGDFNGQTYNPAFIPSGIPINFLPPDPKMYPNFVGFVPNAHFVPRTDPEQENQGGEETATNSTEDVTTCDNSNTAKDEKEHQPEKVAEKTVVQNVNSKTIDIATIVSKLEEAAKEQDHQEAQKLNQDGEAVQGSPRRRFTDNKNNRVNQKYKNIPNYRRNNYNGVQNSPQRNAYSFKANIEPTNDIKSAENECTIEQKLDKTPDLCSPTIENKPIAQEQSYTRRNPDNIRRNWKYQGSQMSPKWQPNSPVRTYKHMQNGKPTVENIRDYKFNQQNKNYSTTLKNKTTNISEQKHYDRQINEKHQSNHSDASDVKTETPKTPTRQPKQPNQWISVSSRKKRKNKNLDESEVSFEENDGQSEKDLFEKYDVDQLVDVVPPTQEEDVIKVETTEEIEIEDIINTITQNEASSINNMENISLHLNIRSVDDIEKELIIKDQVEIEILTPDVVKEEEIFEEKLILEEVPEPIVNSIEEVVKTKSNKKSKKGTQKPVTKRVIITDVDLSMKCEEIKTPPPLKKIITKASEKSNEPVKVEPAVEEKVEEKTEKILKKDDEEEKKKGKKKKKKSSKTAMTSSLSSSNATINNMDDSYDFLLDTALSPESVEKTNVEISQELDKIIQKGMYSSLEEKVKSLNIDDSDGFFKSMFSNITSAKSSVDKNGFNNTLDLTKVLQDSRSLFRPSSVSEETNSQNRDINKTLPDLDSPVEDGIFLENTKLTDTPHGQTATHDKQTEEPPNEDTDKPDETEVQPKTLYPITEAVKEWMSKTRETTPDVEILKSPDAIYKEFCDSSSETDTVVSDLTAIGDEEIVIFAKDSDFDIEATSLPQQDLTEYWENECEFKKQTSDSELSQLMDRNGHIEQGEDALEMYDSKYGKNKDYLNLQREVKERANTTNHANRGNLPYRAICCSIM